MSKKGNRPLDIESALHADTLQNYVSSMKDFCNRNDMPWPLDRELQSAVELAEGCLQQMITCMVFIQDLLNMEYNFKEGEKAKGWLILSSYGSKQELMQKIYSAIEQFKEQKEYFKNRSEDIRKVILSPDYECTDCQGTGSLNTEEVFRERGDPPQLIFRTAPCSTCRGRGKIQIGMNLRKDLQLFSEKMALILNLMSDNLRLAASLANPSSQNP